jgi:hypothetical protein
LPVGQALLVLRRVPQQLLLLPDLLLPPLLAQLQAVQELLPALLSLLRQLLRGLACWCQQAMCLPLLLLHATPLLQPLVPGQPQTPASRHCP